MKRAGPPRQLNGERSERGRGPATRGKVRERAKASDRMKRAGPPRQLNGERSERGRGPATRGKVRERAKASDRRRTDALARSCRTRVVSGTWQSPVFCSPRATRHSAPSWVQPFSRPASESLW